MAQDLRQAAISGAVWRVLATCATQAVQLAGAFVLAWLLDKRDYGMLAEAMIVVSVVRACTSLGMHYAIIQRRDRVQEAVDTGFVLLLASAVVSYAILAAVAPFTRAYALDRRLTWALGLLFFLRPMAVVAEGAFYKGFHFRRLFVVETSCALLSSGVAVVLAWALPHGQRHWALAIAGLAKESLNSLFGWLFTPLRPRLRFDRSMARELLQYNKWLWGMTVVMVLYENLERLALAELLSVAALGLYHFAAAWVSRLAGLSETVFGGVSLSVYAKLQDDLPRLRESYCRIVRLSALLSTALLAGVVLLAPEGVPLAFPLRWLPSVPVFQMLGLFFIVRAVDTTTGQLYVAVGKPKHNLYLGLVNLGAVAATVVPLVLWRGAVGAAACLLVARLVTLACNAFVLRRVLQCTLRDLAGVVAPALKAALVMALVVSAGVVGAHRLWGLVGWPQLGALVALGALSYAAAVFVWERALFWEVVGLIRDALRGKKVAANGLSE